MYSNTLKQYQYFKNDTTERDEEEIHIEKKKIAKVLSKVIKHKCTTKRAIIVGGNILWMKKQY